MESTERLVHQIKVKLGIVQCWQPGDKDWRRAKQALTEKDFQCSLGKLEGLVVAQMFKMNKISHPDTCQPFCFPRIRC